MQDEIRKIIEAKAFEHFQHNVTYIEEEQARKMASENRSLTYHSYVAGAEACYELLIQITDARKRHLFKEQQERIAQLDAALDYFHRQERTKGYPTGIEWQVLVNNISRALGKGEAK